MFNAIAVSLGFYFIHLHHKHSAMRQTNVNLFQHCAELMDTLVTISREGSRIEPGNFLI